MRSIVIITAPNYVHLIHERPVFPSHRIKSIDLQRKSVCWLLCEENIGGQWDQYLAN